MKKLLYLLFAVLFLAGCDKGAEQLTGPDANPNLEPVEEPPKAVDAQTRAIVEAARAVAPIDASKGLAVGLLDEGRTDTRVRVAYYNETVYEVYHFALEGSSWTRGDRIRRVPLGPSLAKYQYTKPFAKLFADGQPRDTWYVPSSITGGGTYSYDEQYQTNLPDKGEFIEDSEVDGTTEIFMQFSGPWKYQRFNPPEGSGQSNSLVASLEIYSDSTGQYHAAEGVEVWYELSSSQVTAPTAPSLSSPSDGVTMNAPVTFDWGESTGGGNITYRLQVDDNSNFSSPSVDQSGLSSTSKTIFGLTRSTTLYWRVRAKNEAGPGNWSSVRSLYLRPSTPVVSATVDANDHAVLSWEAADGATSYLIYREHSGSGAGWEFWTEITSTSYTDASSEVQSWDGRTPYIRYKVRSKDANGVLSSFSQDKYYSEKDGGINPMGPVTGGG